MGLLLLGGLVLLGSVAGGQHMAGGRALAANSLNCPGGKVDLSQRGQISGVRVEDGDVIVVLRKNANNNIDIVRVDGCTGKEKSTINLRGQ